MKRYFLISFFVTIILMLVAAQFAAAMPSLATAAAGDLDTTFGSGGLSYADIGSASGDKAHAVVEQDDGKIVVAGTTDSSGNDVFSVIRLTSGGAVDGSFSGDGKVSTAIGSTSDIAYGVAVQADGKIVVVGSTSDGVDDNFAVVRYGTNGLPDSSFSGDGIVEIPITAGDDVGKAVVIQDDGKIVVAGTADNDFALVRIKVNGTLDNTFSGDGIVTVDFFGSNDEGNGVVIDPIDGSIIVAGFADSGASEDFAVARFDNTGALDFSFGGTGKVTTDFLGNSVDQAFSVALQDDRKIVLGGFVNGGGGGTDDFALARYNSNGLLDTNFSDDGKVVKQLGIGSDQAFGVAVRPTGKIIIAGFVDTQGATDQDFAVARYTADGTLDTTFGGGSGYVLTDLGLINSVNSSADEAYGMAIQKDEKILVAGFSDYPAGNDNFAVVRYLSPNSKPVLSTVYMDGLEDIETFYDPADTLAGFSDADNDSLAKIRIGSLPVTGTLALDGVPVVIDQEIAASEIPKLSFTAPSEWSGMVDISWNASDGLSYADVYASAIITIVAVNDAPYFSGGGDQAVSEDADPQTISGWASGMSPGPVDEESQLLTFVVETDNDALFAALPAIDAGSGDLSFTAASDKNGIALVTVTLKDDGGSANGGLDSSPTQSFTITINEVNDAPSFMAGSNQTVNEDSGLQSVASWATKISSGPDDEAGQSLSFIVDTDNDALFASGPEIDAVTGDLTFTADVDKNGRATISVSLMDDGGTLNGGVDRSESQSFRITVSPVNDPPVIDDFTLHQIKDHDLLFLASDFEEQFTDVDGDMLAKVKILSLPAHGKLMLNGVKIVAGQQIKVDKLDKLVFTPDAGWTGESVFAWNGSDGQTYATADGRVMLSLVETGHLTTLLPVIIAGK